MLPAADTVFLRAEHSQPDRRGIYRMRQIVCESGDSLRQTRPDGQLKNVLGQFQHSIQQAPAPGQNYPGCELLSLAGLLDLVLDQLEHFNGPISQNLADRLPGNVTGAACSHSGYFDDFVRSNGVD